MTQMLVADVRLAALGTHLAPIHLTGGSKQHVLIIILKGNIDN